MQQPRRFNDKQRDALFIAAAGQCAECGIALTPGWHADHIIPFVAGGPTDVVNGQALCAECNQIKGARMLNDTGLREWQKDAINSYRSHQSTDFLLVATPGAGKTFFSLKVMSDLLYANIIQQVVIVVPGDHLKDQWRDEAKRTMGIDITSTFANRIQALASDVKGVAITYASVMANPEIYRRMVGLKPTLVIFDEIHHAGEQSRWGEGLIHAFALATKRLSLSGTPFRGDGQAIPFVRYDGAGECIADAKYDYQAAMTDGVCREVSFRTYEGDLNWTEIRSGVNDLDRAWSASFTDAIPKMQESKRLKTALSLETNWLPRVIRDADDELLSLRENVHGDLAGLVVAIDKMHAIKIADAMEHLLGERPVLVLSEHTDDGDPAELLKRFAHGSPDRLTGDPYHHIPRWIVAVKMVSEGVDIRRLACLVYATGVVSPLFFRQVIGRVVRVTNETRGILAPVFLPADPRLMKLASGIEEEIKASIAEIIEAGLNNNDGDEPSSGGADRGPSFVPVSATSIAHHILVGGEQFSQTDLLLIRAFKRENGLESMADEMAMKFIRRAQELVAYTQHGQVATVQTGPAVQEATSILDDEKDALRDERTRAVTAVVRASNGVLTQKDVNGAIKARFGGEPKRLSKQALIESIGLLKQWAQSPATSRSGWTEVMRRGR